MRKALAILLVFSITSIEPLLAVQASARTLFAEPVAAVQYDDDWTVSFSDQQLDNLLAPIALYPDPLLAQVLLAATFPDQIDEAARAIRAYGSGYNIDSTDWDVSVKAVAHYPTVLSMMADKIDWTTSVGQAYAYQSSDVMEAVQRLRARARSAGNLVTTREQEIVVTDGYIYIYPAQPQYIYVPVYDPAIIYFPRPRYYTSAIIWFGVGLIIGAWLNHDCDWRHHRIYYHGWQPGPIWVDRARPHVRITNIYVNNRYQNVMFNRRVADHNVNYRNLNRYNTIHRDVDYGNVRRSRTGAGPADRGRPPAQGEPRRDNKIIRRNIDPNDPRIDANRGRGQLPSRAPGQDVYRPQPKPPEMPRQTGPPDRRQPDVTQPQRKPPEVQRPDAGRGGAGRIETPRPTPAPPPSQPRTQRPPDSVFRGGDRGPITSRDSSRRGHESRQQQNRPAPTVRPGPAQRTPGPPQGQQGRQQGQQDRQHGRRQK